jgi:hypothetical protein
MRSHIFKNRLNAANTLPEGEYELRIHKTDSATSKNGNFMVVLEMREDAKEVVVFDQLVFTEKTGWKIDSFLQCFDIDVAEDEEVDFDDEFLEELVGKTGIVRIYIEDYNGIKKNKVAAYLKDWSKSKPDPRKSIFQ